MPRGLRSLCEGAVAARRFNMGPLTSVASVVVAEAPSTADAWEAVRGSLGSDADVTLAALLRSCYLIEPVNATITSTKFAVRWSNDLPFPPTHAPFEVCDHAFENLLSELAAQGHEGVEITTLRRFLRSPVLPYEVPIDYRSREVAGIHFAENLYWAWADPEIVETIALRELLRTSEIAGSEAATVSLALNKIRTKTYLTDRALTGPHKTNREKRWETHPASVQFALRCECLKIEHRLLLQLCSFDGFPEETRATLRSNGLSIPSETYRDPITLDVLSYAEFKSSVESPVWGKDAFQVGHLNPLKADAVPGTASGHTAANIGWISADGNRIQGPLGLGEVRALLSRIAQNYRDFGSR